MPTSTACASKNAAAHAGLSAASAKARKAYVKFRRIVRASFSAQADRVALD